MGDKVKRLWGVGFAVDRARPQVHCVCVIELPDKYLFKKPSILTGREYYYKKPSGGGWVTSRREAIRLAILKTRNTMEIKKRLITKFKSEIATLKGWETL